ncbi:hypothetical protein [Longimicrobium sp.]|uniref:hypothetical protein n=1 Tax=Longimicrobium sp. TaxID=2029185 RepID=UPI0032C224A4
MLPLRTVNTRVHAPSGTAAMACVIAIAALSYALMSWSCVAGAPPGQRSAATS